MEYNSKDFFVITKNIDYLAVLKLPKFNDAIAGFIENSSNLNIYHVFNGENILINNEDIFDFTKLDIDDDEALFTINELSNYGNFSKEKIMEFTKLLSA